MRPTAADSPNASAIAPSGTLAGQPKDQPTTRAATKARFSPIKPPTTIKVVASIKTCIATSVHRAQAAIRNPNSRVRSMIETSMRFMIPRLPIIDDTPAMLA